jgi:hypothetical protein
MLKKRLVIATVLAAGVAAIPVPGVDVAINIALLVHEVCHYMSRVKRKKKSLSFKPINVFFYIPQ